MAYLLRSFTVICCILFLAGCAAQPRYTWCKYDSTLYDHYKNPAENEEFVEALKEAVLESESAGHVPPGLYAEYGYVMYEHGNNPLAIQYFQKEADKWPESRAFMAKMITNVQQGKKKKDEGANPAKIDTVPKQGENVQAEVNK
jgi:hypothetical protein